MGIVFGILVAILVFGLMIFFHELGHYAAARLCKVKVIEFAIGMGPKLYSRTSKKTGIVYSVRALPIGGFTSMQGEDQDDEDPGALVNRPKWARFLVLFAGSFMNIVTGVLGMILLLALTQSVGSNVVANFHEDNLSSQYGLQVGDEIIRVGKERMVSYTDVMEKIMLNGGEPLELTVLREGEEVRLLGVVFPTSEEQGVEIGMLDFQFLGVRPTVGVLLKQAVLDSFATVKTVYRTLGKLITGKLGMKAVSGPVGTVSAISQTVSAGFEPLLYLFVLISINLGIMNLLPLPALDGGRLVFLLIEAILRKPISRKAEGYIHAGGMVLLLLFMAVITIFDIGKFF